MPKWERGEIGHTIKVSFQVKRADHPELFSWLSTIPYGKASERIRDILSGAVKLAGADRTAGPPLPPSTPRGANACGGPAKDRAADQTAHDTAPSIAPLPGDSPSEVAITEEAAKMILEMDSLF